MSTRLGSQRHAPHDARAVPELTHALSAAAAGHAIHLAAGTYDSVTITCDGNLVRLAGPAGLDTQTA